MRIFHLIKIKLMIHPVWPLWYPNNKSKFSSKSATTWRIIASAMAQMERTWCKRTIWANSLKITSKYQLSTNFKIAYRILRTGWWKLKCLIRDTLKGIMIWCNKIRSWRSPKIRRRCLKGFSWCWWALLAVGAEAILTTSMGRDPCSPNYSANESWLRRRMMIKLISKT